MVGYPHKSRLKLTSDARMKQGCILGRMCTQSSKSTCAATADAHKYARTQVHKYLCLVSTIAMNFAGTEVSEETHADNYHMERIPVICQSKVREAYSCTLKRFLFRRVWTREGQHAKKIQLPMQAGSSKEKQSLCIKVDLHHNLAHATSFRVPFL